MISYNIHTLCGDIAAPCFVSLNLYRYVGKYINTYIRMLYYIENDIMTRSGIVVRMK